MASLIFSDEEQAIEFRPQFATSFDIKQIEWVMDQAPPHPLADVERDFPVLSVVEILVLLLCLFEPLAYL
jgi:hypothetical protein